jgi:hypothetical protein
MKSKRRHELETNALADALGRFIIKVKPYRRILGYAAILAAALVLVFVVWPAMTDEPSADEMADIAFNSARVGGGIEGLREFISAYPQTKQTPTARLMLAERLLQRVVTGIDFSDPEAEDEPMDDVAMLAEAERHFSHVAENSEVHRPMAEVGLGMVALQEGRLDEGLARLKSVRTEWPQSLAAAKAKMHIEALAGYEPIEFREGLPEEVAPEEEPAGDEVPEEETPAPATETDETPESPDEPESPTEPMPKG